MNFDDGTVQGHSFDLYADDLSLLSSVTLPRGVGKHGAMWRYWASVISMCAVWHNHSH